MDNARIISFFFPLSSKEKPFPCTLCPKSFTRKQRLDAHIAWHQGRSEVCDMCNATYTHKSDLARHMTTLHPDHPGYDCPICSRHFAIQSYLREHLKTHTKVKEFACVLCPRTFRYENALIKHQETHSEENQIKCQECGKVMPSVHKLKEHVLIHSGERPHCCDVCNKSFRLRNDLMTHKKIHTEDKKELCPICQKAFRRKSHVRDHVKCVHDMEWDELKLPCNLCGMTGTKSELKEHICLKKEESEANSSHACTFCSETFTNIENLVIHLDQHHNRIHGPDDDKSQIIADSVPGIFPDYPVGESKNGLLTEGNSYF